MCAAAYAAPRAQSPRGNNVAEKPGAVATQRVATARSATTSAAVPTKQVAARSATSNRTVNSARAATTTTATGQKAPVAARAGTTQSVVNTGTKVASAASATLDSSACQQKYDGCMDAFCILDSESGGRCQCSDKYDTLSQELKTITETEAKLYQIASGGLEYIESGGAAVPDASAKSSRRGADLSMWSGNNTDDVVAEKRSEKYAQYSATCMARMPECAAHKSTITVMYGQRIRSDCTAFENAIKERRAASETKKAEVEKELRTASYEQLKNANKYNLGQCAEKFKECMTTTAECGADFSGCAGVSGAARARMVVGRNEELPVYNIVGGNTQISIAAATYEVLESKKPICESVTDSCVDVRDQVWNQFLRMYGPEIKMGENLAESNFRTTCISKISDCFVNACKDNVDPNNPDGSYDMCLSHPETVKSFCKVEIEPCAATEPLILDYVYARLAAMRVDACTNEVKECLQDTNRCGKDYTQCVGLDTDTIIRLCPYDKLTGCQKVYKEKGISITDDAVYEELSTMVQGIMTNIDNKLLEFCQNAASESMLRVCGDTGGCDVVTKDNTIGAGSLSYGLCYYTANGDDIAIDYSKCFSSASQVQDVHLGRVYGSTTGELGPVVPLMALLDGVIFWSLINIDDDGNLTDVEEYFKLAGATQLQPQTQELIKSQLVQLQTSIDTVVQAIETDPTVQYCMTGRKMKDMKDVTKFGVQVPRFPQLTKQIRNIVAMSALKTAKENYYKKYDEKTKQLMQDRITIAERQAEIKGENAKDVRREAARQSCVSLADMAALPMSPPPPSGWGMWLVAGIATVIGAVVTVVTFGAAGAPVGAGLAALWIGISSSAYTLTTLGVVAAVGVATTLAGVGMALGTSIAEIGNLSPYHDMSDSYFMNLEMEGHHELDQWNWKQVIDTKFDWKTMKCTKCVKSTPCEKESYPLFGMPKCKRWGEEQEEECTDTQF